MITVYKYGPAFGLPDASPFVTKVETYLRLTEQTYETRTADVRKAPRQQLPFVDVDGKLIPDSTAILEYLEAARPTRLDAHLDAKQNAMAYAFKSMLEEHLYFGLLCMRWQTDEGWAVFEPTLRAMLGKMGVPSLMRGFVAARARKQVVQRAKVQGLGRQPHTEIVAACCKILDAVSTQLGDNPYFCGERPTTYDATVYAFLAGVLCPAFDHELRRHAESKKNLVAYTNAVREKYWGESQPAA